MKTFILCLVSTTCYLCLPTSGAAQPKPAWPGEPKLSVLQEITKDEKLPELEVVGDFLLKDDLMLVNSIFSSKIVVFQRAKEDGKLQVLGTIDAHEPLWKQSPTIRGQHTFMHMVFGGATRFTSRAAPSTPPKMAAAWAWSGSKLISRPAKRNCSVRRNAPWAT